MLPGNPREDELINVLADLLAKVKEDGAEFADSKEGTNTFCSDNAHSGARITVITRILGHA